MTNIIRTLSDKLDDDSESGNWYDSILRTEYHMSTTSDQEPRPNVYLPPPPPTQCDTTPSYVAWLDFSSETWYPETLSEEYVEWDFKLPIQRLRQDPNVELVKIFDENFIITFISSCDKFLLHVIFCYLDVRKHPADRASAGCVVWWWWWILKLTGSD